MLQIVGEDTLHRQTVKRTNRTDKFPDDLRFAIQETRETILLLQGSNPVGVETPFESNHIQKVPRLSTD
jgi:hypothetical protein